jgi:hypothetical protein
MTQYPHDQFDDVPAYSDRKGSHREGATPVNPPSGLLWISLAAAFSLIVGAFCYLVLPSLLPSDNASADSGTDTSVSTSASATPGPSVQARASTSGSPKPTATATSSAPAEPTAGTSPAEPEPTESESPADTGDTSAPVEVYNASRLDGLAGRVSGNLSSAGFAVVSTGNWQGFASTTSAVYYSRNATTATAVANQLGLPLVYDARVPGVAVVLTPDYAG